MSNNIEQITDSYGKLLALIIQQGYKQTNVAFHTDPSDSQQVGTIQHQAGHKISRHYHPQRPRSISDTQEVIVVRQGKVKVNFFDERFNFVCSHVLSPLDVLVHMKGGHGFEVIEDCDLVEIKQGPYDPAGDKIHF